MNSIKGFALILLIVTVYFSSPSIADDNRGGGDNMNNPYSNCHRGPIFTYKETLRLYYEKQYGEPCRERRLYNESWSLMSILFGKGRYSSGHNEGKKQ